MIQFQLQANKIEPQKTQRAPRLCPSNFLDEPLWLGKFLEQTLGALSPVSQTATIWGARSLKFESRLPGSLKVGDISIVRSTTSQFIESFAIQMLSSDSATLQTQLASERERLAGQQ